MISYTYIRKSSIRILVGVLCALSGLPMASAKDLQTTFGYWASQKINSKQCVPNAPNVSSHYIPLLTFESQLASCPTGAQSPPIDIDQLKAEFGRVSLNQLEKEEGNFFYDFSHDQIKQSQCEMNLLDALDQLPGVPDAPAFLNSSSPKTIYQEARRVWKLVREDHSSIRPDNLGRTNQKVLLDDIWNKLPQLELADQQVNQAMKALPAGILAAVAEGSLNQGHILSIDESLRFGEKIDAYKTAVTAYNALMSQIMQDPSADPVIKSYTETLLREYKAGLTHDQFINYALQPVDPARPELSFQQKVVEPIRHETIQRLCQYQTFTSDAKISEMWNNSQNKDAVCGDYHPDSGWTSDPENQKPEERNRKQLLMSSDAALEFMNKVPKYRQDYTELSCMLLGKYREGPEITYWVEQGVIMAATFGGGTVVEMLAAGRTIEEIENLHKLVQFGMKNYKSILFFGGPIATLPQLLFNQCSARTDNINPLAQPACEQIKRGDPLNTQVLADSVKNANCATAVALTLMNMKFLLTDNLTNYKNVAPSNRQGHPTLDK